MYPGSKDKGMRFLVGSGSVCVLVWVCLFIIVVMVVKKILRYVDLLPAVCLFVCCCCHNFCHPFWVFWILRRVLYRIPDTFLYVLCGCIIIFVIFFGMPFVVVAAVVGCVCVFCVLKQFPFYVILILCYCYDTMKWNWIDTDAISQ